MSLNYTKLKAGAGTFQEMIKSFGVVTVMNVHIYEGPNATTLATWKNQKADVIYASFNPSNAICKLDTLKVANISQEGPTKTITGGQYANPIIKFGKTSRLEMQDALGNAEALEALAGLLNEKDSGAGDIYGVHAGTRFEGPKTLIGDTFFVDRDGHQVKAKIIFYQFLPDSLFNLTQDAEGDAAVFDLNGDLLVTTITVSDDNSGTTKYGVFYSILDPEL